MRRRQVLIVVSLFAAGAVLASCGFPFAGGMIAGGVVIVALLFGALSLTSLTGCDSRVAPCLKIDQRVGPCLSIDRSVGPCLSIAVDRGTDGNVGPCLQPMIDMKVGPCLKIAPDLGKDTAVGPCLKIAPDLGKDTAVGPCLVPAIDMTTVPDMKVGPCLSPPINDGSARLEPSPGRDEVIERLAASGTISTEQAARMRRLRG